MIYLAVIFLSLIAALLIYVMIAGPRLPAETDKIIEAVLKRDLPEIITGQTGFVKSGSLNIWYEHLIPAGTTKGVVLLMMANGGNALDWPPKFVRAFTAAGYQVIRYDHRSTGLSDAVANWNRKNPYTITDLADDAWAVLDTLNIQKAHLIGLSMGGMVAQEVATKRPDRVLSLTLLSTSGYVGNPDLPGLTSRFFFSLLIKSLPLLKYRFRGGEKNLIKERIAKMMVNSSNEAVDIQETAELVLYDLRKRKGVSIQGALQHQAAVAASGSRYDKLRTLQVPTVVIHGTADQLIPVEHGKKLVEIMPKATGSWLEGVGHVFPYPGMDSVNETIIAHLNRNSMA